MEKLPLNLGIRVNYTGVPKEAKKSSSTIKPVGNDFRSSCGTRNAKNDPSGNR